MIHALLKPLRAVVNDGPSPAQWLLLETSDLLAHVASTSDGCAALLDHRAAVVTGEQGDAPASTLVRGETPVLLIRAAVKLLAAAKAAPADRAAVECACAVIFVCHQLSRTHRGFRALMPLSASKDLRQAAFGCSEAREDHPGSGGEASMMLREACIDAMLAMASTPRGVAALTVTPGAGPGEASILADCANNLFRRFSSRLKVTLCLSGLCAVWACAASTSP